MLLVNFDQPLLIHWLCERIGYMPTPHMRALGNVDDEGNVLGVVGYDGYNGASVMMHVAGEGKWLDRSILKAAFHYPFVILNCTMVMGLVPSGNAEALRLNRHLGFKVLLEIPRAHPDGSLILMGMDREDCKWLKLRADPARMH